MAGESLLNGKDYVLQIDTVTPVTADSGTPANYRTVACEVSHDFNIEKTTNQVSNKCGGGWNRSTFGNKNWGFSGEWQAVDPATGDPSAATLNEMASLAASDTEFWMRRGLFDPLSGKFLPVREGVVKYTNHAETSGTEDPFTFTGEFEGQGEPILGTTT